MDWTRRDFLTGAGAVAGGLLGLMLRGRVADSTKNPPLRPPGARPEAEFLSACIRCEQCIEACPWDTLRMAGAKSGLGIGTPYAVPRETPCTLCEDLDELKCIAACPTDALLPVPDRGDVRMGTAVVIEDRCVAFSGAICRRCINACPISGAIYFDDLSRPVVDEALCVGCGLCDFACPTELSSIPIRPTGASETPPGLPHPQRGSA